MKSSVLSSEPLKWQHHRSLEAGVTPTLLAVSGEADFVLHQDNGHAFGGNGDASVWLGPKAIGSVRERAEVVPAVVSKC